MKRGRKSHRPLAWSTYTDDEKINYLSTLKTPTASEKKELRYLTQKKKFAGFKEWLDKRNAKEQATTDYQIKKIERERKKCRAKREVDCCEQCLRYESCYHNKPLFDSEKLSIGEMRLGQAIVLAIEEDIKRCYKHGWKDQMNYWLKVLASERTNLLTAESVDGYASAQMIMVCCKKQYGDFEPRYNKCQAKYKPILEELENKLSKVKAESKKAEEITRQIGNTIKRLYGDTMR